MNIVEGAIDYVRNKALEIKRDPTWTEIPFKKKKDFMTRLREAESVLAKYPDRIPVVCERATTDAPRLDRSKYLVPADISMGEFMYVIRKRMKILPEVSIYLFVNAMTTVSGVIFLYSYDTTLASVSAIHLDEQGEVAKAAAMAMLIVYVSVAVRLTHTIITCLLYTSDAADE